MKKATKKTNKKVIKKDIAVMEKKTKIKFSKKTINWIIVLLLVVVIAAAVSKFGIVATVNGKPIYRWSYINQLQKLDNQNVLNQMIQEKLISDEGQKKGIKVEQKEIDEALLTIEDQVKTQGMTLDDALKAQGMTKDALLVQIKNQKIAEKLASPAAEINQSQIDQFLKDNKEYLPTGKSKDDLQKLAKEQLESQSQQKSISDWFNALYSSAKIIYR